MNNNSTFVKVTCFDGASYLFVLIPHREGMNNSSYAGCKGENLRGQPVSWPKSRSVPERKNRANPLGEGIPVNSRNWN